MPGPFTKNETTYFTTASGHQQPKFLHNRTWNTSSRDAQGNLILIPQVYSLTRKSNLTYHQWIRSNGTNVLASSFGTGGYTTGEKAIADLRQRCYNQAYQRFYNGLRGETAGIGVNISQWRQSWQMVKHMQDRLYSYARDAAVEANRRNRFGKRLKKERAADVFLEYQFGWAPIFSDMWTLVRELAGWNGGNPDGWYRGKMSVTEKVPDKGSPLSTVFVYECSATVSVTVAAKVTVENPNLWIANRMGLVNPAAILWDRIPWSFLVGAFANVNSYISSFTNDWGLDLRYINRTDTVVLRQNGKYTNTYPKDHASYAETFVGWHERYKSRSLLSGLTRPQLQVRLPKLEWTSALIGSSLLYQQISRLGKPR